MEEKIFELIEKMYIDMQEMKTNMATKQDIARLENKMDQNDKALFDGYKVNYEKLESLEEKVDRLEKNVQSQDVEIRVIKNAR